MRRAAHPSGCERCAAGAGCSAMKYPSLKSGDGPCSVPQTKSHIPHPTPYALHPTSHTLQTYTPHPFGEHGLVPSLQLPSMWCALQKAHSCDPKTPCGILLLFLFTLEPRVERCKRLYAVNTSPPRNHFTICGIPRHMDSFMARLPPYAAFVQRFAAQTTTLDPRLQIVSIKPQTLNPEL